MRWIWVYVKPLCSGFAGTGLFRLDLQYASNVGVLAYVSICPFTETDKPCVLSVAVQSQVLCNQTVVWQPIAWFSLLHPNLKIIFMILLFKMLGKSLEVFAPWIDASVWESSEFPLDICSRPGVRPVAVGGVSTTLNPTTHLLVCRAFCAYP